jgi:anti-anti-sigma factor
MDGPEPAVPFEVDVDASSTETRFEVRGDLDIAAAPILEARVASERPFRAPVSLDVSGLLFVDSSGIRLLTVIRHAAVQDVGTTVTLVGCGESLSMLLELSGLRDAFEYE